MLIALIALTAFLAFTFWPFAPKPRPGLTDAPGMSALVVDVAHFNCEHAEIFMDRPPVERPSLTITVTQRPPGQRPV
jgi:hypothetical protein